MSMQTPIDLLALAGQPRQSVAAVLQLDDDDGVEAMGPFHELVAYFDAEGRLVGGHVFFNEPQTEPSAQSVLAEVLNIQPGDRCAVQMHSCVHRPEIITAGFRFTL